MAYVRIIYTFGLTLPAMILGLIIKVLLFYLAIRFIFGFIVPMFRTTKMMSDKIKDMNDRLRQQEERTNVQQKPKQVHKDGDYIDYEEV